MLSKAKSRSSAWRRGRRRRWRLRRRACWRRRCRGRDAAQPVYAFAPLRPGRWCPGSASRICARPRRWRRPFGSALGDVSPRTRAVTLVVPDTSVRVFVLDFDSLPNKAAEVVPVLRFRLRKMVPFDVEHAGVSYQVLSQDKNECRVLTAVLPGDHSCGV